MKNPGWSSKLCAFAAIGIVVLTCEMAHGQNGESALIPPQSNFRGLSFEEWNVRWSEWQIGTGLGEQTDLPDTIRGVRFLPGAFAPGEYEFDVCVRPGTAFVFPGFFVFGERYDDPNVPDDDPDNPILDLIFETTFIEIRLDGRVIRAGLASELDQFGPEFFADPIVYAEPQPRGPDLNSVAALFVLGPGAVFRPMSAGEHLLETNVNSLFFGEFNYAHNIHVTPRGR